MLSSNSLQLRGKWILLGMVSLWMLASFCVKDRVFRPWVSVPVPYGADSDAGQRQELVELLDRIVRHQHYYRDIYGRYTQFLNRIGVWVPRKISAVYEIRVTEASSDSLMVTAVSEVHGKVQDRISIDQHYQVTANFQIPSPRETYLKALAERAIRKLTRAPDQMLAQDAMIRMVDRGVFRGYYRFEIQKDSDGKAVVSAVGIREPVLNSRLEFRAGTRDVDWDNLEGEAEFKIPRWVEQFALESEASAAQQSKIQATTYEEAYLAKRIFEGEIGRSPRGWDELQWIGDFGFEGRQTLSFDQIPSDLVSLESIRIPKVATDRAPASSSSQGSELIIEEIAE
ncbi:MAG: hypothetical protein JNL01_07285 [Bdellovibrionales bacterium]|nr:hypothetical protein [Bdellovibrionales bacterium]